MLVASGFCLGLSWLGLLLVWALASAVRDVLLCRTEPTCSGGAAGAASECRSAWLLASSAPDALLLCTEPLRSGAAVGAAYSSAQKIHLWVLCCLMLAALGAALVGKQSPCARMLVASHSL